jgi:glycosyltransferase involved in cell wall biosynthesis
MSRIVIDARESGASTGRYIDKLVEYLHKLEPEHEIIVLTIPDRVEYLKSVAPRFRIMKSEFPEFTVSEQLGLRKQIKSLKPDLVHFGMTQQPILYRGKVITTIHDLTTARYENPAKRWIIYKLKQWVYRGVILVVAHKSKLVLVPSKFVKKDLANYTKIKPSKIKVTYEAADKIQGTPVAVPGLNFRDFIMYVGRPLPHKNLRRLMEAFSILRHTRPDLKLVLAGKKDSLYKQHEKWAEKEHIEGLVFTGFVTEPQLRWLYENTAAYVFPSLSEVFGLPPLEAMMHGAPVISSNATCLPEINGEAAIYFKPKSVSDMTNKIALVLDDRAQRQGMVAKGYEQVRKYSWQRMAEQTLEAYNQVLEK